jgi:hypothetical protein
MIAESNFNQERRVLKREYGLFPVRVRGQDGNGEVFDIYTLVENISVGGLYLQLPNNRVPCDRLFSVISLPGGALLATRGRIVRQEARKHGLSGLAVCFSRNRLIPAQTSD